MRRWAGELADDYLPDGWERVSSSAFARVAGNRERQLYFKEYLPRSPAESLKNRVRGSRATRARLNADALLFAGIDAPENILWGQLPGGSEYLFTAAAPGKSVTQWLHDSLAEKSAEQVRLRRLLLGALGTFIGRVHATGFVHGNLRPDNILAAPQGEQFRFTLLNNERNLQKKPIPGKKLLRDLIQLNMLPRRYLGLTDRTRFFCAWRRQMRDLSPMEAKILATEAYRRAMRRVSDEG